VLKPGQILALCVLALLTLGVVMVNSADMAVAPADAGTIRSTGVTPQSILLSRSTAYMGLALAAMAAAAVFPVRRVVAAVGAGGGVEGAMAPASRRDRSGGPDRTAMLSGGGTPLSVSRSLNLSGRSDLVWLGLGTVGFVVLLLLAYAPVIGREVNGSHRWIGLPIPGLRDALSVQPSEIAKWGLVGLLAWFAARRASVMPKFWTGLAPALAAVGLVSIVIIKEDLGTGILVGAASVIVLLAAGARLWQLMLLAPAACAGLAYAVLSSDYRRARVLAFLDPYADPEKTGYHMIQSMLAVSGGEGAGRGLGHGLQKFGYLPEDRTDFLAAVVFEELGIAGALLIVALFLLLVWTGLGIARREQNLALKLFTLGVVSTVGLQAIINLTVVTGLGPTKGIALPLVSSGGTGWILTAFSLGLVMAISRTQHAAEDLPEAEPAAA
jgi:cell division protein FtsW